MNSQKSYEMLELGDDTTSPSRREGLMGIKDSKDGELQQHTSTTGRAPSTGLLLGWTGFAFA